MKVLTLAAVLAMTTCMAAQAETMTPPKDGAMMMKPKGDMKKMMVEKHFEMMDTDKDGKISKAESEAFADKKFSEADANGDGFVTKEEATAQQEKDIAKWKEKHSEVKDEHSKKGSPNVDLPNRTNANPSDHSMNATNPSQEGK